MTVLLSAAGLTCRFGALTALDGVELTVLAGQRRAIIGPNGAGKTTLLAVLSGNLRPAAGRVLLDGRDITGTSPARRAILGVGRTFQTPAVAATLSALDNVLLGAWPHHRRPWLPAQRRRLVAAAFHHLTRVGLAEHADLPAGRLSHGQRRLLELAVALAGRPRLLALDEPAAGLSDADLARLTACLRGLPPQVGVLLVEHDMRLVAAIADQVTVLHQGAVLAEGPPAAVAADPAVAAVYLGTGDPQPAGRR